MRAREVRSLSWLVIGLVLLVAFGPVLWLVPSRRDRTLTRMRARARTHGLHVDVVQLDDPDPPLEARVTAGGKARRPTIDGATYRLSLPRKASLAPAWSLSRASREAGPPGVAGWQWASAPAGDEAYWERLAGTIAALPADAFSCASGADEVSVTWRERAPGDAAESAVDALAKCLQALAEHQRLSHVARETELERQRFGEGERDGRSG